MRESTSSRYSSLKTLFLITGLIVVISCTAERSADEYAEQWLAAVENGDSEAAIRAANALVPDRDAAHANIEYVRFAESLGVAPGYFDATFRLSDYTAWRTASFFRKRVHGLRNKEFKTLFGAVTSRLDPFEQPVRGDWPDMIWTRGYGLCDRQAWVLCELAYQAGWEVQLVYLMRKDGSGSPHTICELRRGSEVWTADPYSRVALNESIEAIAASDERLKELWPDHPDWHEPLRHSIFFTPCLPADYCSRNQTLARILEHELGERIPRISVDPDQRRRNYSGQPPEGSRSTIRMALWHYPFRLLQSEN